MAANLTQESKAIDIKKVFFSKNQKLANRIPGFVFKYLRKITHENLLNEIVRDHGHLKGFDFSVALLKMFNIAIIKKGEENIPESGRFIFASNHPLGGLDGHILMFLVGERFSSYKFLVNDILMKLKNMSNVFIPVNKHGRQGAELAIQLDDAFKSDTQILTFPAGIVSRRIKGEITDLDWKKMFINKSKQYKRDIIPVHISGRNSEFFYRLYKFRKIFGIKANIEMLYLINESYKNRDKTFTVTFGEPISYKTFDSSKRPAVWADWVKNKVYLLPDKQELSL